MHLYKLSFANSAMTTAVEVSVMRESISVAEKATTINFKRCDDMTIFKKEYSYGNPKEFF